MYTFNPKIQHKITVHLLKKQTRLKSELVKKITSHILLASLYVNTGY